MTEPLSPAQTPPATGPQPWQAPPAAPMAGPAPSGSFNPRQAMHRPAPQAPLAGQGHPYPQAAPIAAQPPGMQPYPAAQAYAQSQAFHSGAPAHAPQPAAPHYPSPHYSEPSYPGANMVAPTYQPYPTPDAGAYPAHQPMAAYPSAVTPEAEAPPKSLFKRLLSKKAKTGAAAAPTTAPREEVPTPKTASSARTPFLAGLITGMALMFLGAKMLGGGDPEPASYAPEPFAEAAPATGTFLDSVTFESGVNEE